ncbi:tRNA pseudouridine(55) synthase TruB [Alphaproteobacteria bacterium]|nr:tRNA pseudouridine(55) synthase TruB [Alphaproteobacteria bacterium]
MANSVSNRKNINGWLIFDKPKNISSTNSLNIIKKLFNAKKAGHGGTLDPLATGVLPIAFGEATKVLSYIVSKKKQYEFTLKWGEQTDTDDSTGRIINTSENVPKKDDIQKKIKEYKGEIDQIPPIFSAIKLDGKRSYELARKGIEIKHISRKVNIYDLDMISSVKEITKFNVVCGKGTYIRSLARDLGKSLNSEAHIIDLRRTFVGTFSIENAFSLDSLEKLSHTAEIKNALFPIERALDDIPALKIDRNQANKLKFGQAIKVNSNLSKKEVKIFHENILIAIGHISDGLVKPIRVFNL